MELSEVIAKTVEWINQEPRYYRELVRLLMEETGYSFSHAQELIGQAIWVLTEDDRIQKIDLATGKLTTSTVWTPYSLYIPVKEPPVGWKKYEKLIEKKTYRLKRIAQIGLKNAKDFEELVYRVVKSIYGDAIKTPFTSSYPDVYVPSRKIVVEATTRFEYPITENYLKWKYFHVAVPVEENGKTRWKTLPPDKYDPENPIKMLVVAPAVGPSAWKFIKNQTKPGVFDIARLSGMPLIKVIQFPKTSKSHAGWPLFRKYAYYRKWLEELHRKVYLISYRNARRRLKKAIENAFRNWEEQEEILLLDRTYND